MSDITLAVQGLRKVIGTKEIIKGIDFELRRGCVGAGVLAFCAAGRVLMGKEKTAGKLQ
ncbi:hypothetical protein [Heliophilum fasciatum]|uniref:Uncharacterized protein n=1 Tax=Heliophilum fasciatum TaxID=35700 RepID=A0A4R2RZI2_9FIRM|nr:hypothetical protein [Heliophilum fasciatum]MCW2276675.1 ABC-type histidine transport system ATPase subunit [Heliophilum fasciatum]TCP68944.1 hypothetical protein EDD73_101110 [Heliophilum fasciatum]